MRGSWSRLEGTKLPRTGRKDDLRGPYSPMRSLVLPASSGPAREAAHSRLSSASFWSSGGTVPAAWPAAVIVVALTSPASIHVIVRLTASSRSSSPPDSFPQPKPRGFVKAWSLRQTIVEVRRRCLRRGRAKISLNVRGVLGGFTAPRACSVFTAVGLQLQITHMLVQPDWPPPCKIDIPKCFGKADPRSPLRW